MGPQSTLKSTKTTTEESEKQTTKKEKEAVAEKEEKTLTKSQRNGKAVKIKQYLLKEDSQWTKYMLSKAPKSYKNSSRAERQRIQT